MIAIVIEKNIPKPLNPLTERKSAYADLPFDKMVEGDSFSMACTQKQANAIYAASRDNSGFRQRGLVFSKRRLENGTFRFWCVKRTYRAKKAKP